MFRSTQLRYLCRVFLALMLIFLSGHLLLLYLDLSFRSSALVGLESEADYREKVGTFALVSFGAAVCLQFIAAWALYPGRNASNKKYGFSPFFALLESKTPIVWERYSTYVVLSLFATFCLFLIQLWTPARTKLMEPSVEWMRRLLGL